ARLEKECEEPFHRERVADHAAGVSRKRSPVRAELELHRDAGHDADREVDAENPNPEPRRIVPARVAGSQAGRLENDDEQREAHRQLRKEIVVDDREGELQTMPERGVGHSSLMASLSWTPC